DPIGEHDHDAAFGRAILQAFDAQRYRFANGCAIFFGHADNVNLVQQGEQGVVVEREWADTIGIARKGHHTDEVPIAAREVFAAPDKAAKCLLDRVQTTALVSVNL